jgi:hypothetical protein
LRRLDPAVNGIENAKLTAGNLCLGGVMAKAFKTSLLEKIPVLIVLGILAGAVGGLGIGLIQMKSASSSSATSAGK